MIRFTRWHVKKCMEWIRCLLNIPYEIRDIRADIKMISRIADKDAVQRSGRKDWHY